MRLYSTIILLLSSLSLVTAAEAQTQSDPAYPYGYFQSYLKVNVTPNDAEVYIDGYYSGRVDDYDGPFQRLHVESGPREIVVYKPGFRPLRERLYLSPYSTQKIAGKLERLAAGEPDEGAPRPAPAPAPAPGQGIGLNDPNAPTGSLDARSGILSVRVQPGDAELIIDGDRWPGTPGDDRVLIELSEGKHTVELRKAGYRRFSANVEVRPRQTTPLNVNLTRE